MVGNGAENNPIWRTVMVKTWGFQKRNETDDPHGAKSNRTQSACTKFR